MVLLITELEISVPELPIVSALTEVTVPFVFEVPAPIAVGFEITAEEDLGAKIAILLHDIGHGPFSHALEQELIQETQEHLPFVI